MILAKPTVGIDIMNAIIKRIEEMHLRQLGVRQRI